jgi:hypothetical protein
MSNFLTFSLEELGLVLGCVIIAFVISLAVFWFLLSLDLGDS